MTHDRPGGALLHPVPLVAIVVLLVNDHVLKAAYPGFVTGKLSDVAGLVFFPLLLVAIAELFGAPRRPAVIVAVASTGLVFALVQIWAPATQLYRYGLGALQWPFRALVAGKMIGVVPVHAFADPTDLVALPALLVPLVLGWRRARARSGY